MGYQFSFDRAGLLAQNTPTATEAGSPPSNEVLSALPDIGKESVLYVCPGTKHPVDPNTKHPVDPNTPCVRVAVVEQGSIKHPEAHGPEIALIAVGVIVAIVIGFVMGRISQSKPSSG